MEKHEMKQSIAVGQRAVEEIARLAYTIADIDPCANLPGGSSELLLAMCGPETIEFVDIGISPSNVVMSRDRGSGRGSGRP